jgi:hypothetical protein
MPPSAAYRYCRRKSANAKAKTNIRATTPVQSAGCLVTSRWLCARAALTRTTIAICHHLA